MDQVIPSYTWLYQISTDLFLLYRHISFLPADTEYFFLKMKMENAFIVASEKSLRKVKKKKRSI